ncbi:hypothetical protein PLEOSDRAFT_158463 [Pleurotus ostreatus PC15]|uniref:Uncharacterized protein n=1 Tax=Pleurotus ostreatus (strain PC15) TaxID=1137138 RepID=A0A067NIG4_PLEO1|nr:hypothetical protein PLEOSDRAFT_158463 [Pleurotus ostreatus PC15]
MPFFDKASDFTITESTMNDIAGDYRMNKTTNNTTATNSNNTTTETVTDSYNDSSQIVPSGVGRRDRGQCF